MACMWLYCNWEKEKPCTVSMQGKRKARPFLTGLNASYLDALNNAEKNQKKNRTQDKITACTPLYHAEALVGGFTAALCVNIRVQRLE